jgi:L-arabinose isomerase
MDKNKIYFLTGSQDLYGAETLKKVAENSKEIAKFLGAEWQPVIRNSGECEDICVKAFADKECVGVIVWCHTFSPAKMWIRGLQALRKPLLHLHTQFNEKLPYDTIDMDFMNLNQSAHGDREFGFICTRLGLKREIVAGFYKNVKTQIERFRDVASAINFSKRMKVAMLGSNMRDVAVTDGDRVESEIKYGWNVNYYGIGDLVELIDNDVDEKMVEYRSKYEINEKDIESIKEQAKYEVALEKFIKLHGISAFTNTFQDLHGLRQLPGLAVQNLMGKGIGFAAEGDYKTAAMMAVMCKMAENRRGNTGFMEDYTYDLTEGKELVLGAHMLEVSPSFAARKPKIEVHPLEIGGKEPPARLVFDGIEGDAVAVSMVDMGTHFRLIAANIELVGQPKAMPNLPVARVMWKLKPNFKDGATEWLEAGGAHHAVVSTAVTMEDMKMFAKYTDTEIICIGDRGIL